ncbi:MAG: DUF1223 domain-containing protein [Nevskia sp.]
MTNGKRNLVWSGAGAALLASGVFALMAPAAAAEDAGAARRPVLVELFTSQGCSSCPPADAVLRDLSAQAGVLPLAFHVDYWDYLGWADPFASPAWTSRQQQYARRRGFNVYTPQLVVDGRAALVGSNRGGVDAGIASAKGEAQSVASSLVRKGDEVAITVGSIAGAKTAAGTVYLISFDTQQTTAIQRGENAGRSIVYSNVVRSMRSIGDWHNLELKLSAHLQPDERGERLALLVQNDGGEVWAVASTPAPQRAASRN